MPATRTSSKPAEITPVQRRDEIIAILATGLARLVKAGEDPPQELSESGRIGLELPRETRLSVPAG